MGACVRARAQSKEACQAQTYAHMQDKVLPRRTSATLSSLKLAKYSLSAAVLSKLPTQARKRYQLPGGGGEASCGQGALYMVSGGSSQVDDDMRVCGEGNCPLVFLF